MIKVIAIGTDRRVFEKGSAVRSRLLKQRELFRELHVVVFSRRSHSLRVEQLGNLWLYPTNSLSRWFYVRDAAELARGLAKQRDMKSNDSVITAQDPFECGLAGYLATRGAKLPLHLQIHTDFLNPYFEGLSLLNKIRVFIAEFIVPKAAGIRVVSKRIKESIGLHIPKARAEVHVLPVFSEYAQTWTAKPLRRYKKDADGAHRALMVSRLAPEKDFSTALAALKRIFDNRSEGINLVIAGEGPEERMVRHKVHELGLSGIVRFELWQVDPSSLYRACDMVLLTSRFEGYGLVLLEAAAYGRPIITTDVGIARELIIEPYQRFICSVGDSACIAERIRELAGNDDVCRKYGSALRTKAKELIIPESEYWKRYASDIERCIPREL